MFPVIEWDKAIGVVVVVEDDGNEREVKQVFSIKKVPRNPRDSAGYSTS